MAFINKNYQIETIEGVNQISQDSRVYGCDRLQGETNSTVLNRKPRTVSAVAVPKQRPPF